MFMGRVNGINRYKHGITRTYLNLDDKGNCYLSGRRGAYVPADWKSELAKLEGRKLLPGMSSEAMIRTGARSVLAYLAEPITQNFRRALREK